MQHKNHYLYLITSVDKTKTIIKNNIINIIIRWLRTKGLLIKNRITIFLRRVFYAKQETHKSII